MLPCLIEGPEFDQDYSYYLVHQSPDLKDLERGIPLANFEEAVKERELDMEFRVLTRLNCHKLHYMNLFKS